MTRRAMLVFGVILAVCVLGSGCAAPARPAGGAATSATAEGNNPSGGPPASGGGSKRDVMVPVIASVLAEPIPVPATDGRIHLAYELMLTNLIPQPATITSVEVRAGQLTLQRLEGDALAGWIKPFGAQTFNRVLQPGQAGVVFLDATVAATEAVPPRLEHVIGVQYPQGIPPLIPPQLTETVAPISPQPGAEPVLIGPPLAGAGWVDANSCCAVTVHRAAVNPLNGRLWVPERFAIDYVRIDESRRMMTGEPTALTSYPYEGADIHAVADGPIVAMVTDQPEQKPSAAPTGFQIDEYGGNYTVQDIGGGRFAFYAHQQPNNPLGVAVAQHLRRGQVIGRLGNSGHSDGPHLHFQIMDNPDPLASNGLPFEIDSFTLDGRISSAASLNAGGSSPVPFDITTAGAGPRQAQSPLYLDVMTYPAR